MAVDVMTRQKDYAQREFNYAVQSGKITRPKRCSQCGAGGSIEGHHPDYAKPLEVIWLCHKCHSRLSSVGHMKYKLRDKRKRNQLLKAYYKANPELTLSEIGETFGVSRQRVKQIIDNGVADKAEDNKAGS